MVFPYADIVEPSGTCLSRIKRESTYYVLSIGVDTGSFSGFRKHKVFHNFLAETQMLINLQRYFWRVNRKMIGAEVHTETHL